MTSLNEIGTTKREDKVIFRLFSRNPTFCLRKGQAFLGRPSTSCTEANVESVRFLLASDRCLTIRLIAAELRRHGSTFETNSTCPSRALPNG
ncbi:hypothetical protein WH47_07715 [Habropoda laboriosa]|uniref:Uncharacterized protein n=1 Tax=Habropoda laboriosa TaxID=597456 RepID=A0A0L7QPS8_9HYME|nr:hypothetical protein WH47_07715 [Habropoda laboriosa]